MDYILLIAIILVAIYFQSGGSEGIIDKFEECKALAGILAIIAVSILIAVGSFELMMLGLK